MIGDDEGCKTKKSHWDEAWESPIKPRLPSRLNVGVLNITRLLKKHVRPGSHYLEIGCAPGKMLAWVSSVLKAEATGLDYSETGIMKCYSLFDALGVKITLYHADIFNHEIPSASFDVVASFGVIEHFEDARQVVQRHIDLVKPGGVALITIPNYGGIYGVLQRWCDAPNLALHNLSIMDYDSLRTLVVSPLESVHAYTFGSISPWLVSLNKRFPRFVANIISLGINTVGLLQPWHIQAVSPMLVLEVHKGPSA